MGCRDLIFLLLLERNKTIRMLKEKHICNNLENRQGRMHGKT